MKKILKKLFIFSILFTMLFPYSKVLTIKAEEPVININQTVDEDLKAFNFDYERYKVDPELVYRPILINFNESASKDYMDLLYVYDPNNAFYLDKIEFNYYAGDSEDKLELIGSYNHKLYLAGTSEDKTIKRYAVDGYNYDLRNYKFRRYDITHLGVYKVESSYLFNSNLGVDYNNCMNIVFEDAHNWSWHFDEDTGWQNFWDLFSKKDTLHDQLFYSFYIPDKWDVTEIKSIDLQYKKVLLEAYRHNVADEGTEHEFYKDSSDINYRPKFYAWNDNNTADNLDKSNLLGHSIGQIGNKVDYTRKTIVPDDVSSTTQSGKKTYVWNKIQSLDSFKESFGTDSDIYKFAKQYFTKNNRSYWIINYDDFFYTYIQKDFYSYMVDGYGRYYPLPAEDKIIEYLISKKVPEHPGAYGEYYEGYYFTEEYTFDISARFIEYEDSKGVVRNLPVSVSPVMEKEGSGGGSDKPFGGNEDWWEKFLQILKTILAISSVITLSALIYLGISKAIQFSNDIELKKSIKDTNKILKQFKNKDK